MVRASAIAETAKEEQTVAVQAATATPDSISTDESAANIGTASGEEEEEVLK